MAEALLQARIKAAGLEDKVKVLSAGLAVFGPAPASAHARTAMAKRGLDIASHRSRPLLPELAAAADVILTMTAAHKRAVADRFPAAAGKVFTLAEYAGEAGDVADPFGGSEEHYEACAVEMERFAEKIWQKIAQLAGKREQM